MKNTSRLSSEYLFVMMALLFGAICFSGPVWAAETPENGLTVLSEAKKARVGEAYGRLPLYFIENQGQVNRRVKYYARHRGHAIFFTSEGIYFTFCRRQEKAAPTISGHLNKEKPEPGVQRRAIQSKVVQLTPLGMSQKVKIVAAAPQEGKINYFIGNDPSRWRTNIPTYRAVLYREAYPGIDLKFYGTGSQLEYDIIVKPGADPNRVRFQYRGIKGLEVTKTGDLAIKLPDGGELMQKKPLVYQEIAGNRVAREGRFKLQNNGARFAYSFEIATYDPRYPLVIDPVLVYSTYLGGNYGDEYGEGIAVDQAGHAYITGRTWSWDFPTQNPFQLSKKAEADVFVTKFDTTGTALVYSTFLGGSSNDYGYGIAVDQAGNVYISGATTSVNFPTLNPWQLKNKGGWDAFVTQLNAAGSALVYSTYLGGSDEDTSYAIAVDQDGNAYITGRTWSSDFPRHNPLQKTNKGWYDAFITKINADGSALVYSTYLGGKNDDVGEGIAADQSGNAYITGLTGSTNFPLKNAFQCALLGGSDAFITKINTDGSALVYSTLLGGSDSEWGYAIAVDQLGQAYVTGKTFSSNFPTQNPLQSSFAGGVDVFVTKFNVNGSALVYSTYLGGSGNDFGYGIGLNQAGQAYVTGWTDSSNFPTRNPLQRSLNGPMELLVSKLNMSGSALVYSTYLGGSGIEEGLCIAIDRDGRAYVTGYTGSSDFPTQNPFQPEKKLGRDVFVTKLREAYVPLDLLLLGD